MKKANELRKTEQGLPQPKSSTLHAETKPPWRAVEEPAVCSDTPLQLCAICTRSTQGHKHISVVCAGIPRDYPAVSGSEEQVSAGSYVNYG